MFMVNKDYHMIILCSKVYSVDVCMCTFVHMFSYYDCSCLRWLS